MDLHLDVRVICRIDPGKACSSALLDNRSIDPVRETWGNARSTFPMYVMTCVLTESR